MKQEKKSKFSLEKFKVAELKNPRVIVGGQNDPIGGQQQTNQQQNVGGGIR